MSEKVCTNCHQEFDEKLFLSGRTICKSCRSLIGKESYAKRVEKKKNEVGVKTCNICQEEKDVQEFRAGMNYCKECQKEKRDKYLEENKPVPLSYKEVSCPEGFKICKDCYVVKKEEEFRPKRNKCKKCENKERVAYNKGQIQKLPQMEKEVEEDDFAKQLKASCRIRIRETLPLDYADKISKEQRFTYIYEFLDCDMEHLKKWLRYNYTNEMKDKYYGATWSMDHVIPIKTFDIKNKLEENKKCCYGWFNISPLGLSENFKKSITINKIQLQTHLDKLLSFCEQNEIEPNEEYLQLCAKHLDAGNPLEPLLPPQLGN